MAEEKKVLGYTCGDPYPDASTSPLPTPKEVTELTEEQYRLLYLLNKKKEMEMLIGLIRTDLKSCTHGVFKDEDAYPYYSRVCQLCGAHIDTI